MELVLYMIIIWFAITYFITVLPKEDLVINIILYMILLILTVSVSTVVYLNYELINFTEDKMRFIVLVLNRNVEIPTILVIFSDIYNKLKTYPKKITAIILILIFTSLMEVINLKMHLYEYVNWSFMLYMLVSILYIFISVFLKKWLLLFGKEVK